ncbi:MAG: hypothetical protein WA813_20660, partial [Beijerinckiaceae bacterium]
MAEVNVHGDDLARHKPSFDGCAICVEAVARHCHVWTYMDPARLQPILASSGPRVTTADVYPASYMDPARLQPILASSG